MPYLYVIHSTRSGVAGNSDAAEREGTARWFRENPYGLSAHFIGDAEGGLTPVVPLERAAHHAGDLNLVSVGVELTQPCSTDPFTDGHYRAAAEGFRRVNVWLAARGWPAVPAVLAPVGVATVAGITGHSRVPGGIAQGKTDPGDLFDFDRFVATVQEAEEP